MGGLRRGWVGIYKLLRESGWAHLLRFFNISFCTLSFVHAAPSSKGTLLIFLLVPRRRTDTSIIIES